MITKDINEEIILGLPFATHLKPYLIDFTHIRSTVLGVELDFPLMKTMNLEESQFLYKHTTFKMNLLQNQNGF